MTGPQRRNGSWALREWLEYRRVCRSTYYNMLADGTAPKTYFIGTKRFISEEADREWLAQREEAAA